MSKRPQLNPETAKKVIDSTVKLLFQAKYNGLSASETMELIKQAYKEFESK